MEIPTADSVTSNSINISWSKPLTQNGEVTEYVLKLNNEETYRGRELNTELLDLRPHTSYHLVLYACTNGGCTASATMSAVTEEAPPTGLASPTLKVCLFILDSQWKLCYQVCNIPICRSQPREILERKMNLRSRFPIHPRLF